MEEGDHTTDRPRHHEPPGPYDFLLRRILEALPIDVILYDTSLCIRHDKVTAGPTPLPDHSLDRFLNACTEKGTTPAAGWSAWLRETFTSGEGHILESVILLHQGQARWTRIKSQALPRTSGQPELALLTIEDMGQLARARQRLDHQERLAALGKMTSKVAHELNSPLDGILRYLNLATRAMSEHRDDKSREYLERCREGLHRMVHIVGELLEHARLPRQHPDLAPLRTTIDDALHAISVKASAADITVETHLDPELPDLHASQLYQVLCNVFRNAFEAMPGEGRLRIDARLAAPDCVELTIMDSGEGIDPADLNQVFDPFFTTKESGTGLGLAVSREILQGCGGTITIDSQRGQGTTVSIRFPLARMT